MKKIFAILSLASTMLIWSCDSYLDRQPDDQLTSENVFQKQKSTFQYLVNCYSFIPGFSLNVGYDIREIASDEGSCAFTGNRFFALANHGGLSAATSPTHFRTTYYQYLYYGIRESTFFMRNVDRCKELTDIQVRQMQAEARFLRAYYYMELITWNGPVVFLGDELVDFNDRNLSEYDRSDWMTIVNWICNELDDAAEDLPLDWGSNYLGRATKGAAMALKARLLTYSARPLLNGQNGRGIYDNLRNKDGNLVFCTTYDATKWKTAADACKDVIDLNVYNLVDDRTLDPVLNYHNIFISKNSSELIFSKQESGNWRQMTMPCQIGTTKSYGGCGATQKLVDHFAMANGRYPIRNLEDDNYKNGLGVIDIDPQSGYKETGYTSMVNKYWQLCPQNSPQEGAVNTMNMYVGREPRFYANIVWSGQRYTAGNTVVNEIQLFRKGSNGPGTFQNYSPTGYLPLKFNDPDKDGTTSDYGSISWPIIRYADILLYYIECLNEYDPTNSDILKYWNMIRSRAGVPEIGSGSGKVYGEIVGDKDLQRKFIRRERMVEMCFEGSRYIDCNTWMISEKQNSGAVVGCNINITNHELEGNYWKRTSIFDCFGEGGFMTERVFKVKNYFLPINQEELDRVPGYTQNLGW